MQNISAIFETRFEAEQALNRLESIGVTNEQVSVLATDEARNHHFKIENTTKAEEGASTGAALGGLAGAVVAGLLSAGAVAIPGLNVVVSGYLISALAGLGAGGVTGGVVGALIGLGFQEHEAKLYEKEIMGGNILVAVKPHSSEQSKAIRNIFDDVLDDEAKATGRKVFKQSDSDLRS